MENILLQSNIDNNTDENIVLEVFLYGDINRKEYKCAGVFIKEDSDFLRLAFNVVEDKVVDYFDINKKDIISVRVVGKEEVKNLY